MQCQLHKIMHPARATNEPTCPAASASAMKLEHEQIANVHHPPNGNMIVTHGGTLQQQSNVQVQMQIRLQIVH